MFNVGWLQTALDGLTDLWTRADAKGRKAITAASHELDQLLAKDPRDAGESRSSSVRIVFVYPLAVRYRIETDGRTVTVLHVRTFHRRRP